MKPTMKGSEMTYHVTAMNTHPTKGHHTTIEKTMQTTCGITAEAVADIWESEGYSIVKRKEG